MSVVPARRRIKPHPLQNIRPVHTGRRNLDQHSSPARSFGTSRIAGCNTPGGPGREISTTVIREGAALMPWFSQFSHRDPAGGRHCPSG